MGRLASVCLVVTLASLGLWACTEYVAGQLEYAPELGPPLAILGGVRLYATWGWMEWIDERSSPMSTDGEAAEGEVPTTPEDLPL
jgi:hypothetical protein